MQRLGKALQTPEESPKSLGKALQTLGKGPANAGKGLQTAEESPANAEASSAKRWERTCEQQKIAQSRPSHRDHSSAGSHLTLQKYKKISL